MRLLACLLIALAPLALADDSIRVSVQLAQDFYYAGDPLELRVSVQNVSDSEIDNPVKNDLFDGIKLTVDDFGVWVFAVGLVETTECFFQSRHRAA